MQPICRVKIRLRSFSAIDAGSSRKIDYPRNAGLAVYTRDLDILPDFLGKIIGEFTDKSNRTHVVTLSPPLA